jgi:hypothetical protein
MPTIRRAEPTVFGGTYGLLEPPPDEHAESATDAATAATAARAN